MHVQDQPATGSKAPLVLLPGTLCDARVFAPMAPFLAGREVKVAEMTGGTSTAALAATILAAAPPRFIAMGFSLGGIVALEMAAMAPERLSALALISSSARPDKPEAAERRRADVAEAQRLGIGAFLIQTLWPRYVGGAAQADAILQRLVVDMAEALGHTAFATQTEVAITRADSRPRLPGMRMPVLILAGEQDAMCPPLLQHEMAATLPSAQLHLIANAGHFVLQESPRAAPLIAAWLDSLTDH